jgi:hypothetical protein
MMREIVGDEQWQGNIFKEKSSAEVMDGNKINDLIASNATLKVLLARWMIFRLFIEEARNQGRLGDDLKQDWLYFQILPASNNKRDLFALLIDKCLGGISSSSLRSLGAELNACNILGPELFNNQTDHFFYILDEMQAAGTDYLGCFSNEDGTTPRPILRPIIRTLSSGDAIVLVSGTGFSLSHFQIGVQRG